MEGYKSVSSVYICDIVRYLSCLIKKKCWNGQLSSNQQGFISQRFTVTNLPEFSQFVCKRLDEGGQIDVFYNDFSKAFNRMDHLVLFHKLSTFGSMYSLMDLYRISTP